MMKKSQIVLLALFFITAKLWAVDCRVEVYSAPKNVKSSERFTVSVWQQEKRFSSFVYYSTPLDNDENDARKIRHEVIRGINANEQLRDFYFRGQEKPLDTEQSVAWTCFSFSGEIQVEVTVPKTIGSFKILPSSVGIAGTVNGNKLRFSLNKPQKLAVVIDNDYLNPLFVFGDPLEVGLPDKNANSTLVIHEGEDCKAMTEAIKQASVLWFEPGVHHIGVGFQVYGGQTVYLEGGSYLLGTIHGFMAPNVTIKGRGVLAGDEISRSTVLALKHETDIKKRVVERLRYHAINMLCVQNDSSWNAYADYPGKGCDNLVIEGITIASPRQFFIRATGVPMTVYNVKMVGAWSYNTDGFSGIGQTNTTVFDCFFHSNDDAIYVSPNNCHIHHCNFWQGNNGCVFQFSWGSSPQTEGGGFIHDCNVLHVGHVAEANNRMVFGSRKSGPGDIENIHFKDINIEGPVWSLIRLETNGSGNLGSLRHVTFENIHVNGPVIHKSRIISSKGRADKSPSASWIRDVTFKNVVVNGNFISTEDLEIGDFQIENIVVDSFPPKK